MVDEKDLKILKILASNSRIPLTHLAHELRITDVAIKKRIKRLEEDGVIIRYTIVVDPEKIGYNSVAWIGINVEPGKIIAVAKKVSELSNVIFVALASGDHEVVAEVWARNNNELAKIIEAIGKIDGVTGVYPSIVLDIIKHRTGLPE
ncbi:MAG TPA: Lrp/AsnC family transcriptional regulator [Acidilobales archaeon]|nr:Lrp/AsnC family transcriptional regulator [Acidilobales archaeon]